VAAGVLLACIDSSLRDDVFPCPDCTPHPTSDYRLRGFSLGAPCRDVLAQERSRGSVPVSQGSDGGVDTHWLRWRSGEAEELVHVKCEEGRLCQLGFTRLDADSGRAARTCSEQRTALLRELGPPALDLAKLSWLTRLKLRLRGFHGVEPGYTVWSLTASEVMLSCPPSPGSRDRVAIRHGPRVRLGVEEYHDSKIVHPLSDCAEVRQPPE
jgi:hypothetical protein